MNFSVKNMLRSCVVFSAVLFFHNMYGKIIYRQAELEDVDALMHHYEIIEQAPDDKQNLVVYPIEVRRDVLEETIKKSRFFVAVDDETDTVIGFIKMFVIAYEQERMDILKNEIRCMGSQAESRGKLMYCIVKSNLEYQLGSPYGTKHVYLYSDDHEYIYYGGAYTEPEYRNQGICSSLIAYALGCCYEQFKNKKFSGVAMVYGQTHHVVNQQAFVRKQFAQFISKYFAPDKLISVLYAYNFKAFKPELVFEDGVVKVLPHSVNRLDHDFGNVLLYKLDDN